MKQQFLVDKADTIRLTVYESNRPLIPSAAKITLYTPSGGSLQAEASASIDATTGEMTYSLTTTHTDDHDLNYKAVWKYTSNGTDYYETQLFDVVKSILSIPIVDDDIYNELDSLRQVNKQETGTATAGAAGTLTDTAKRKEADDFWKGGILKILKGTSVGQQRDVTGNTQSTGVISVTPNWTTNPDTTSVYVIIKSFANKIEHSFNTLETMLYNRGKRHSLILESSQIELPLLYLVIHKICLDLMNEEGDKWNILANKYEDNFKSAFSTMALEYDEDESGAIDSEEEQESPTQINVGRG